MMGLTALTITPPSATIVIFNIFYQQVMVMRNVCLNTKICESLVSNETHMSNFFNHLKLWVAIARHNFKWRKIPII